MNFLWNIFVLSSIRLFFLRSFQPHLNLLLLGHDEMISCLAAAHASIFNTQSQAFFYLNHRVKRFCTLREKCLNTEFSSSPYFPAFGQNTGKYGPERNSVFGHFSHNNIICKILPVNIVGNLLFDSPSFINTNFNVRNS